MDAARGGLHGAGRARYQLTREGPCPAPLSGGPVGHRVGRRSGFGEKLAGSLPTLEGVTDFPSPAVSPVSAPVVLDTGEVAQGVARALGLSTQRRLPVPGERPVLLVISDPAEIDALNDLADRTWIGAIVAWQLPESTLERVYEFDVAVFVGMPAFGAVVQSFDYPMPPDQVAADRLLAGRLAALEALLD